MSCPLSPSHLIQQIDFDEVSDTAIDSLSEDEERTPIISPHSYETSIGDSFSQKEEETNSEVSITTFMLPRSVHGHFVNRSS